MSIDHYNCTSYNSIVQMGCYGIGVSRILAAAIEYGCAHQSERLVWPRPIVPYPICIAPMTQVWKLCGGIVRLTLYELTVSL